MADAPKIHVAIIPDGNRRWAKAQGLFAWKGHEKSAENLRTLLDFALTDGRVSVFTLWCFSTDNWKREQAEVDTLMKLLEKYLQSERVAFMEKGIRLVQSGRKDRVPKHIMDLITDISAETAGNTAITLHLALDYSGQDEMIRAMKRMTDANAPATDIQQYLDQPTLPPIDLIIRTSGEKRTSNFFLWQAAYAEWVFLDKFYPDMGPEDLKIALDDYQSRVKRVGS